jgi:hypothetical protein
MANTVPPRPGDNLAKHLKIGTAVSPDKDARQANPDASYCWEDPSGLWIPETSSEASPIDPAVARFLDPTARQVHDRRQGCRLGRRLPTWAGDEYLRADELSGSAPLLGRFGCLVQARYPAHRGGLASVAKAIPDGPQHFLRRGFRHRAGHSNHPELIEFIARFGGEHGAPRV